MNILDLISMSVIILYIFPFILYIYTKNPIHFKAFLGVSSTTIISEGMKYFLIGDKSPRPKGAKDCDVLCKDGNQGGQPGMPSSHSASVAFFTAFYYQQTENKLIRFTLIVYTGLVMLSRYLKQCHTINQIIGGSILGLTLSWLLVRQL